MIIAWWHKDIPQGKPEIIDSEILPWLSANWVEWRPATPEEIKEYKQKMKRWKHNDRR